MGCWLEFRYPNYLGKPVGHTCYIGSKKHFADILMRYNLAPTSLFDIKVNGKPMTTEAFVQRLKN